MATSKGAWASTSRDQKNQVLWAETTGGGIPVRPQELDGAGVPVAGSHDEHTCPLVGRQGAIDLGHLRDELLPAEAVREPLGQLGPLALAPLDLRHDAERRHVAGEEGRG